MGIFYVAPILGLYAAARVATSSLLLSLSLLLSFSFSPFLLSVSGEFNLLITLLWSLPFVQYVAGKVRLLWHA